MSEKIIHCQTVLLESTAKKLMEKAGNIPMKDALTAAIDFYLGVKE